MNIKKIENKLIFDYWKTFDRINDKNIIENKYIKKPYFEKYIIELAKNNDDIENMKRVQELIENSEINYDDIYLYLFGNIDFSSDEKRNIQNYILNVGNHSNYIEYICEFIGKIIIFNIAYFRFYMTIVEFLYDIEKDDKELYRDIFIYIKNTKNGMNRNIKKSFKFQMFIYYINKLYKSYNDIFDCIHRIDLLKDEYDDNKIRNLFLKNLFSNWYHIYKTNVENGIDDFNETKERKFISKLLCIPNI
jgi:hypothetical protein